MSVQRWRETALMNVARLWHAGSMNSKKDEDLWEYQKYDPKTGELLSVEVFSPEQYRRKSKLADAILGLWCALIAGAVAAFVWLALSR